MNGGSELDALLDPHPFALPCNIDPRAKIDTERWYAAGNHSNPEISIGNLADTGVRIVGAASEKCPDQSFKPIIDLMLGHPGFLS
jgi:hypothetical protein